MLEQDKKIGLAIWLTTNRHINKLKRFGEIHYVSKKMDYIILYVKEQEKEDIKDKISSFHFIKKIQESQWTEMKTEFKDVMVDYRTELLEKGENSILPS